jgi:protein-S-isoprenylcysteine O-methyltransferase Ste14
VTAFDISDGGLRLALFLNAGTIFIVLGLAVDHFFRCPAATAPLRLRVHRLLTMGCSLLHLGTLAAGPASQGPAMVAALGLYMGGLALFLWAQEASKGRPPALTFSTDPPEALTTGGPFAYIRHPFYVAFLLIWWAGAVGTGSVWVAASALWMTAAYAWAAHDEERAFLHSRWAEAYRAYSARTGRWWPRIDVSWPGAAGAVVRGSHAVTAALVILTMLAAVIIVAVRAS